MVRPPGPWRNQTEPDGTDREPPEAGTLWRRKSEISETHMPARASAGTKRNRIWQTERWGMFRATLKASCALGVWAMRWVPLSWLRYAGASTVRTVRGLRQLRPLLQELSFARHSAHCRAKERTAVAPTRSRCTGRPCSLFWFVFVFIWKLDIGCWVVDILFSSCGPDPLGARRQPLHTY
jgi:hypothetical protein